MCYKTVHGLVNIPFDALFKFADCRSTRGHPLKLLYPDARINARAHSFPVRVVSLWNRLPAATVLATNLQTFKTSIRNIDFYMHISVRCSTDFSNCDLIFLLCGRP